jgi:hypothetical protein
MIPMADMLNAGFEMGNVHLFGDGDEDNEVNRKALEEQGPGYTMSTTKAIGKGEQIVCEEFTAKAPLTCSSTIMENQQIGNC